MLKSDVSYPDYLPSPLLSSNTSKRGQTFVRGDSRSGLAQQVKAFSFQNIEMGFAVYLNGSQGFLFENFIYSGLGGGMKWFNMKRKTARGLEELTVRFTEIPSSKSVNSNLFLYSGKIEVFSND